VSEYYPFRQIDLPELCRNNLTHGLVPTIATGRSNGKISYWNLIAELEPAGPGDYSADSQAA
jgi:hypothetical protein